MRSRKMLVIVAVGLMVSLAQMAGAAQTLTVNGEAVDEVILKTGQTCTVEVVSDNSNPYSAYVGFDDGAVLGNFSHQQTMPEAGDLGGATEYSVPTFYGYFVTAAGSSPSPSTGVHFVFTYNPSTVGTTTLKLYDSTLTVLLDSVEITVLDSAIGTTITYQGRLMESDDVADGLYDLLFELYDSPSNGNLVGSIVEVNDLDIVDGYFTVDLDFEDPVAFNGEGRWLEIGVRAWDLSDPNGYTVLSPRQRIAATPHALGLRGVYVDSDEKVGIGTTTPKQNVTVQAARPRIGLVEDGGDGAVLEFHEQENQLRLQHWTDYGSTWNRDMMVLDGDTGHVGIGTTNPYQKLHIMDGGIGFTDSVNPIDERLLYFGITGIGPDSRGYKFSWRNDDGSMRSDSMILDRTGDVYLGGKVGIGTTNPYRRLTVDGGGLSVHTGSSSEDVYFSAGSLVVTNSGEDPMLEIEDTPFDQITFSNQGSQVMSIRDQGVTVGYTSSTPPGNGLTVKGNVGIGTASPQEDLHIYDATGHTYVRAESENGYAFYIADGSYNSGLTIKEDGTTKANVYWNTANDSLSLNEGGVDALVMKGGDIGIGVNAGLGRKVNVLTDSHLYGLYVENTKDTGISTGIIGWANSGEESMQSIGVAGHAAGGSGNNYGVYGEAKTPSSSSNIAVYGFAQNSGTGHAYAGFLDGDVYVRGNMGIGDSLPASKLEVSGGCITGSMCSDIRLKKNIEPLPSDDSILDRVMGLQAVTFEWKHKENDKRQIGLIAQDVEEVFPEVVTTPDNDSCEKGLLTIGLDAVLVEAIKELKVENELLKDRIRTLEKRMDERQFAASKEVQ